MIAPGLIGSRAQEVLAELERRDVEDQGDGTPKERRVRCVTRAMGALLHALVLVRHPRRILELGTSAGYSTIWLAAAARHVGADVVTVDMDAHKQQWARANLERAGLVDRVRFELADGVEFARTCDGPWDLAFLDLSGSAYLPVLEALADKIGPGGVVLADGWRSVETWTQEPTYRRYLQYAVDLPGFTTILLPFEKGTVMSIRDADATVTGPRMRV